MNGLLWSDQVPMAGRTNTIPIVRYGRQDGLFNCEVNQSALPNSTRDVQGRLWFATVEGAAVIDPGALLADVHPPPVELELIRFDNEVVWQNHAPGRWDQLSIPLKLEAGRGGVLEVAFSALSKYVGHDQDWVVPTTRRAFYTNLRPGKYRFQVTAAGPEGVWNPSSAEFAFSLAPHFHDTWTFLLLYFEIALFDRLPKLFGVGHKPTIIPLRDSQTQIGLWPYAT